MPKTANLLPGSLLSRPPSLQEAFPGLPCYRSAVTVYIFASTLVEEPRAVHLHIFPNTPQSRAYCSKWKRKKGEDPNELGQTECHGLTDYLLSLVPFVPAAQPLPSRLP